MALHAARLRTASATRIFLGQLVVSSMDSLRSFRAFPSACYPYREIIADGKVANTSERLRQIKIDLYAIIYAVSICLIVRFERTNRASSFSQCIKDNTDILILLDASGKWTWNIRGTAQVLESGNVEKMALASITNLTAKMSEDSERIFEAPQWGPIRIQR